LTDLAAETHRCDVQEPLNRYLGGSARMSLADEPRSTRAANRVYEPRGVENRPRRRPIQECETGIARAWSRSIGRHVWEV